MKDLSDFQRRVFANVAVGEVDESMPTLKSMKWVLGTDALDAIRALLDGVLTKARACVDHEYSLSQLRFDRRELLDRLSLASGPCPVGAGGAALTQFDAARFLSVKPGTIPFLVHKDAIEIWPGGVDKDERKLTITMTSLEKFADKYIGQIEAAEVLHLGKGSVAWALEEMRGIKPVYVGSSVVSSIYLREEVLRSRSAS
jgi:hypothetical protein